MATESVNIPGELFSRLRAKAEVVGKTVDELEVEALSESLNESIEKKAARWAEKYGQKSGYTPDQVPENRAPENPAGEGAVLVANSDSATGLPLNDSGAQLKQTGNLIN